MKSSSPALWCALIFVLCALPGILTRDLSSVNELNYVVIAREAMARGDFFCFNEASYAFPPLPPLYIWICMEGLLFEGGQAAVFLLSLNAIAFALMMLILDRTYGQSLLKSGRGIACATLMTLPSLVGAVFIAQPAMLTCALSVSAIALLSVRADETLRQESSLSCPILTPALLVALMLLATPYALALPLLTVIIALALKRHLALFFTVMPPVWFAVILAVMALWMGCTFLNGGAGYLRALFFEVPLKYFSGGAGHVKSAWYLLGMALVMGMPLVFASCYAGFREIVHDRSQIAVPFLFALIPLPLTFALLCLPAAKSELLLLPSLPSLGYVILFYLQQVRLRDRLIKALIIAGMAPCGIMVLVGYFTNDSLPVLNSTYVICAVVFIALFTALSVLRIAILGSAGGLSSFAAGIMVMIVTLGFAVPRINPYVSPMPAVRKAVELSSQSGVRELCVIGIPKPWTLNLADGGLKIMDSDLEGILSAECGDAYRLLGRGALRQYEELRELRRSGDAYVIGDSVLLEPEGHRSTVRDYWR